MKKCFAIIICVCILLLSVSCNNHSENVNSKYDSAQIIDLPNISQELELSWDDNIKSVLLINKTTNKIWSTIPEISGENVVNSLKSPLNIVVSNTGNLAWENVNGFDFCIQKNGVSCKELKNGNGYIVTYKFPDYGITIPVSYELTGDCMTSTILISEIVEESNYKLVYVALSPNLCSVANTNSQDSYIFVPSGSGSLMYVNESADETRAYSGEIYGNDYSRLIEEYLTDEEKVRLPVFGIKDGNNAIFSIINGPVGTTEINASAGDKNTGRSSVYPKFFLRGYDIYPITSVTAYLGGTEYRMISEDMISFAPSISYFPVSGDDADYNGMANLYKNYLLHTGKLTKTEINNSSYAVSIYGGIQVKETTLGIPHYETKSLTNYNTASDIVSDLSQNKDFLPSIRMIGFGKSGINPGEIAGGFILSDIYGNEKELNQFEKICKNNNLFLNWDFDIVRFESSGEGFSSMFDVAKTPSLRSATLYPVNIPLRTNIEEKAYHLLTRSKTDIAVEKIIEYCSKQNINSVSLFTFTDMAYSDYSNSLYYAKDNIEFNVQSGIDKLKDNGLTVSGGPNLYSALASDVVYDVPISNGYINSLSCEIPFYQMVFHGYKTLFSTQLNSTNNINKNILSALAFGTNMSFGIIGSYDTKYQTSDLKYLDFDSSRLYSLLYDSNKAKINESLSKYKAIYKEIASSEIKTFRWETPDVSVTEFSNGKILYVNHSSSDKTVSFGELEKESAILR